jgi:hypothetical protein
MFEASVDGEAFDMDRWGQYFKPSGYASTVAGSAKAAKSGVEEDDVPFEAAAPAPAKTAAKPVVKEEVESSQEETKSSGSEASSRAADIIAMIRKRQTT